MNDDPLQLRAINETVSIEPYDANWPALFAAERQRLSALTPELIAVEHIGSTAIPGLAAKPIIDIIASVSSIEIADPLVDRLCSNGYITSPEFNRTLGDRRWLMRHAGGRRTHHLHLLPDVLRQDRMIAGQYAALKQTLATTFKNDREGYSHAKASFIAAAVR